VEGGREEGRGDSVSERNLEDGTVAYKSGLVHGLCQLDVDL